MPFRGSETEFIIVDVEEDIDKATTYVQSQYMTTFRDIEVKFARLSVQMAKGDINSVYQVDCHFGSILNHGDAALGYDIKSLPIYEDLLLLKHQKSIPDVVLIRKHYPKKVKKRRKFWKLKRMPIEVGYNQNKKQMQNENLDMEELREELE